MVALRSTWVQRQIDGEWQKTFAFAHAKTVYTDYANGRTLNTKLKEIDTLLAGFNYLDLRDGEKLTGYASKEKGGWSLSEDEYTFFMAANTEYRNELEYTFTPPETGNYIISFDSISEGAYIGISKVKGIRVGEEKDDDGNVVKIENPGRELGVLNTETKAIKLTCQPDEPIYLHICGFGEDATEDRSPVDTIIEGLRINKDFVSPHVRYKGDYTKTDDFVNDMYHASVAVFQDQDNTGAVLYPSRRMNGYNQTWIEGTTSIGLKFAGNFLSYASERAYKSGFEAQSPGRNSNNPEDVGTRRILHGFDAGSGVFENVAGSMAKNNMFNYSKLKFMPELSTSPVTVNGITYSLKKSEYFNKTGVSVYGTSTAETEIEIGQTTELLAAKSTAYAAIAGMRDNQDYNSECNGCGVKVKISAVGEDGSVIKTTTGKLGSFRTLARPASAFYLKVSVIIPSGVTIGRSSKQVRFYPAFAKSTDSYTLEEPMDAGDYFRGYSDVKEAIAGVFEKLDAIEERLSQL